MRDIYMARGKDEVLTRMDNVASQGQLMVGMGIISQEEKTLIG